MEQIFKQIEGIISDNDVVLYMKGSKDFPQCGFSAAVSHILNQLDVDFLDVDILKNNELRQAIKEFSDWPTIPQLYIKGQFVGGCDIIKEMYEDGQLQQLLKEGNIID